MSSRSLINSFVITPDRPAVPAGRRAAPLVRHGPPRRPSRMQTMAAWVRAAWRRHRSRVALAGLDAHALRDIGITRVDAEHEANKPFWRG